MSAEIEKSPADLPSTNLVDVLRFRTKQRPDAFAFTFLRDGEGDEEHLSFEALDRRARLIGAFLQQHQAAGKRVLLLYPPGIQFITAFFGCLYAGAVAVPAYPPRVNGKLTRLQAIAIDAQPTHGLTNTATVTRLKPQAAELDALKNLQWLDTDELLQSEELISNWRPPVIDDHTLAFIQYTSGSTGQPKGVMISHRNLLHNQRLIKTAFRHPEYGRIIGWLPLYHDMGLIGNVLHTIYTSSWCVLMSPVAFIQRPVRWLDAITRYKAQTSGGPSFAYDLCTRKVTADQRATLHLSSWQVAFNGAEPVRADVLERFAAMFESCGFRRDAFHPCYGLAESTLLVTGRPANGPPVTRTILPEPLEQRRVVKASAGETNTRTFVGCGESLCGQQIKIVDPDTRKECAPDAIGEIWVRGDSVARGYWNRPEQTAETFQARLAQDDEGPFLRTGDLGFISDGELFLTGRLKDLIIINGRNHYPQDIERTIEQSYSGIRPGCVAAFAVEIEGEERLVTVQEIERANLRTLNAGDVEDAIREAVSVNHELELHAVVLLKPGSIPKTTSGKLQRQLCVKMFLAGDFIPVTRPLAAFSVESSGEALESRRRGMQFSLLYFSSNEADFTDNKYELLIEGAKFADQHDFTAIWIPERHFHAFGGLYPNPSVLGSALAMITERIRIRAGSVVLPLQNPIRVAEEWSVIDNLSCGRVDLSFARGWNPNDFVLAPNNYANSTEILFKELQTVRQLWKGEAIKLPNGAGQETEIKIYPLPKQRELRFWITCSGGVERFTEAGACGANVLTALLFQSIDELAEKISAYRAARVKHGHDPNTGHITLMLHTFIDKDIDVVRRTVRSPFIDYLKTSVSLWRHGSKNLDDLNQKQQEELLEFAFERYFQTSALFGTPTGCLSTVLRLQEVGVDEIACLIDFGIDTKRVLLSIEALNELRIEASRDGGEVAAFESAVDVPVAASETTEDRELVRWLQDIIVIHLARSLDVDPQKVPLNRNFYSLGVSSLKAVEIMDALSEHLAISLSPTVLFEAPTVPLLAKYFAKTHAQMLRAKMQNGAHVFTVEVQDHEAKLAAERPALSGAELHQVHSVRGSDVAVIGMSCRFPQAPDLESFWELLRDGKDAITDVPMDHWDWRAFYSSNPDSGDKTYSRWGGFLGNIDKFDPLFFNISPREARLMDPQQRIFLEVAWETCEHAGYSAESLAQKQVGVFVGSSNNTYYQRIVAGLSQADHAAGIGNQNAIIANRVSFCLDLHGPSLLVDTMCSSSLVALHLALQSLRQGDCEVALAGGVNILLSPEYYVAMSRMKAHSPDGRCKAFDHRANGIVFGEGAGAVMLKPLARAIADGDAIYAVITGSAVNHGGQTNGLTAPNPQAQAELISRALDQAGVSAETISYVEAHGTGTSLGDPIEIAGLSKAFRRHTDRKEFCAIGSVKTNIGHLEPAAGISGLIKVILSMQHRQLPPTLHFEKVNPIIPFDDSPFKVNTELRPWVTEGVLRAGVSSFGIGGSNAHVVLEEAPRIESQVNEFERPLHILTLSAKSETALRQLAGRYAKQLGGQPEHSLGDICFTANTGRVHFTHRLALTVETSEQLTNRLQALAAGEKRAGVPYAQVQGQDRPKVAFLFTGQGAQYVGMGRQLYQTQPTFRAILERCDQVLRPYLEQPLLKVIYSEDEQASELLRQTAYAQPALFAFEYALAELWRTWGIMPDAVIGHSVGEYVAACVAGVFGLEEGLELIAKRGRLMQSLPGCGEMAAVFTSEDRLISAIADSTDKVSLAAINAPEQVVISGHNERVDEIVAQLARDGVSSQRLHVSHAFHSPLMEPILDEFEQHARQVVYRQPRVPLVSNLTGAFWQDGETLDAGYWRRHVRETVKFASGLQALAYSGCQILVEVGPSPILLGMAATVLPKTNLRRLPSLRTTGDDWKQLAESLSALYLAGVEVDWQGFDRDYRRRRVPLPTYPFQRKSYWFEPPLNEASGSNHVAQAVINPEDLYITSSGNGSRLKEKAPALVVSHKLTDAFKTVALEQPGKERVLSILQPLIAGSLEMESTEVDLHIPFLEMGADSLVLIEAVQIIQDRFGVRIPIRDLFEKYTTLDKLADYLQQNLPPDLDLQLSSAIKTHPSSDESKVAEQSAAAAQPTDLVSHAPSVELAMHNQLTQNAAQSVSISESSVERVIGQQLRLLSDLFSQQLTALRSDSSPSATQPSLRWAKPESSVQPSPPADGCVQTAALSRQTSREPTSNIAGGAVESIKASPWVPYQPLDAGRMEELTARQQQYLKRFIERYVLRTPESKRQTQQYRMVHADLRPALSFRLCTKEIRYPIIGARSQGSRLWDVDDNEYIDFTMGYGLNLFGHNAPFVQEAIEEQLKLGMHVGPQTQLAGEVAELITEMTGLERVTFCNTGTEAIMAALRLARTATGRNKVVVFTGSYHGTWDGVLVDPQSADGHRSASPMVPGIPAEVVKDVLVLNYGTARSLEVLAAHLHELAAVLVEPVQSRRPEFQPREFLHEVRRLTEQAGVALIFDEVITGFRILPGGAQAWFGVQADLATYGKIIGGGLPIGVVAGKARFMNPVDGGVWTYGDLSVPGAQTTLYSGTFCKHPLTMAAARAVLRHIKEHSDEIYPRLNRNTAQLAETLNTFFDRENVPVRLVHFGSLFRLGGFLQLTQQDGMDLLFYHFISKGIYVWEGRNWFLSTVHTDEEIQRMIEVVKESVEEMREGGFLPDSQSSSTGEKVVAQRRSTGLSSMSDNVTPCSRDTAAAGNGSKSQAKAALGFPLTDSQKHMWLLSQMDRETSSAYTQCLILRMDGPLRLDIMRRAFQVLVNRHESLRTTFSTSGDIQHIWSEITIDIPLVDFSDSAPDESKVDEWLKAESCNQFSLERGPLLRAHILRLHELSHLLVLAAHHIVTDGWSLGVLLQELSLLYTAECRGDACQLPQPVQFRDYLERQGSEDGVADIKTAEAYWLQRMDQAPVLELPLDYLRPSRQSYAGARQQMMLDSGLCVDLMRVSGELGCTLFMTLLAAFKVLVRQLTGQEDIIVVAPVAGQALMGGAHLIGDCSNLLALRTQSSSYTTFVDYLGVVKDAVIDANEYARYSFTTLMRRLNPPRDPSRWPFFNIDRPPTVPKFFDLKVQFEPFPISYTSFDIALNITQIGKQLQLGIDYKDGLFDAGTIQGWMQNYEAVLYKVVTEPESRLVDLPAPVLRECHTLREQTIAAKLEPYVAPRTEIEEWLAKTWREILNVARVGIDDNFFALGGHSLLATQLISRVRETFKVELPLAPIFEQPTIAALAACIDRLLDGEPKLAAPSIEPVPRHGNIPLSLAQQRLWFIEQLEPGNVAYNILGALRLRGKLDVLALEQAFSETIKRHESLRTTFAIGMDGSPSQIIGKPEPLQLSLIDLRYLATRERDSEALARGRAGARIPFDLGNGPLIRVSLMQLEEEEYVVVLTMHHIVSDGWSVGVIFYEVATLYEAFSTGKTSPLPDLPIQYGDYAIWQREYLGRGALDTQLDYWLKQLEGAPPLTKLPTDRQRLAAPSFQGANEAFTLTASLIGPLREFSQHEGATLFMTLLAAFTVVLHRYSGQEDMIVGTDVANRNRLETEGLIGFFVNLLALRINLKGDPSFRELLGRVKAVTIGAYEHQEVPFEQIVSALRPDRSLSKTPFVQALFVMQNTPLPVINLSALSLDWLPFYTDTAEFELIVSVEERPEGLTGTFAYSLDLFDRSTIIRLQKQFRTLLEGVLADPDQPLSTLSFLTAEERGGLSTADFPEAELSQKDLESLVMSFDKSRE